MDSKLGWIIGIASGMGTLLISSAAGADADLRPEWDCEGVVIHQIGPSATQQGKRITYEIRLSNEGDCDLDGGSFTDYIPRRSLYQGATPEPSSYPGSSAFPVPVGKIEWVKTSLPRGAERVYHVTVDVLGPPGRAIVNTACFEHSRTGRLCASLDTFVKADAREM